MYICVFKRRTVCQLSHSFARLFVYAPIRRNTHSMLDAKATVSIAASRQSPYRHKDTICHSNSSSISLDITINRSQNHRLPRQHQHHSRADITITTINTCLVTLYETFSNWPRGSPMPLERFADALTLEDREDVACIAATSAFGQLRSTSQITGLAVLACMNPASR